jgi:hypothetical protein
MVDSVQWSMFVFILLSLWHVKSRYLFHNTGWHECTRTTQKCSVGSNRKGSTSSSNIVAWDWIGPWWNRKHAIIGVSIPKILPTLVWTDQIFTTWTIRWIEKYRNLRKSTVIVVVVVNDEISQCFSEIVCIERPSGTWYREIWNLQAAKCFSDQSGFCAAFGLVQDEFIVFVTAPCWRKSH